MEHAKQLALASLSNVVDPEVGLDIVSMGLVYGLEVDANRIRLKMTLTAPGCPLGAAMAEMAAGALRAAGQDRTVEVEMVWAPPWSPEMISPDAAERL
ncbi:MAG: hypothetical protein A3G41_07645 [Elusimicrobia bacterium RIFCSPLOWO2_12_FULL_59_9]|nr:MAG: hypothetical protein A3G41_07645 [Elusimicrobia bacterium RIFCSPLOWO2_12_FULL_59_9]